jgi:hypothetical protein
MKSYILSLSALLLAIIVTAFTSKIKTDYTFVLKSVFATTISTFEDNATSRAILENPSNWEIGGNPCPGSKYACSFKIEALHEEFYHLIDEVPILNTAEDVDNFSQSPALDNDSDGIEDISMSIIAGDGIFQYQSSPALYYQVILNGDLYGTRMRN